MLAPSATEFCGRCGSARDAATLRFCRRCGATMPEKQSASLEPTARPRVIRWRPPAFVAGLSVVTFNVYGIGWFGTSWADLAADSGNESMDPIGHALAMLVPVYGQFRAYAHFGEINARLGRAGSDVRVDPRVGVAALTGSILAAAALPFVPGATAQILAVLLSVGLLAYVVATGQRALNVYWTLRDAATTRGVRVIEKIVLAVFGVVFALWLLTVASGLNTR